MQRLLDLKVESVGDGGVEALLGLSDDHIQETVGVFCLIKLITGWLQGWKTILLKIMKWKFPSKTFQGTQRRTKMPLFYTAALFKKNNQHVVTSKGLHQGL